MHLPASEYADPLTTSPAALVELVDRIARTTASAHADAVDREARFPVETIRELRQANALGALVPIELGGPGCTLGSVAAMCTALGRRCAASAMVFAMHQIQVAVLLQEPDRGPELSDYLRSLALDQRLIASVTSEIGTNGELRRSIACAHREGEIVHFRKASPTISYVEHADDLLVTLRREPEAAGSDQILVLARAGDYVIEDVGEWNTLGMRGTCSPPATILARVPDWQVLPTAFRLLASVSMVPASHILWSAVWLGIASDASDRARRLVQTRVRKDPEGQQAPALRLSRLSGEVESMRAQIESALREHEALMEAEDPYKQIDLAATLRINDLKLTMSERLVGVVTEAIQTCGVLAYRNDGEFSLGRHLRDAHSAPLMIHNDRIRATNTDLLLVYKGR